MGLHIRCSGSVLSGLLDLSNRVCGLNDQSCFLKLEAAYSPATRAVACSSACEGDGTHGMVKQQEAIEKGYTGA